MLRNTSGGEAGARRTVTAIPPLPMRGAFAFPPVTGLSFGKNQKRAVDAAPVKKPAPFVIAAATTGAAIKKTTGIKPATAAPFSITNKFTVGANGLKFGLPPVKASCAPSQQQARPASRHPSPSVRGEIACDNTMKHSEVGSSGGAGLLPQAFSWNGYRSGPQESTNGSAIGVFGKPTATDRSKASHGSSTPTVPRKIPLIPTLLTPTRSPGVGNASALAPAVLINFIKPGSASRKRTPSVVQPSPDASRSAKRPKQAETFVMGKAKQAPPAPDEGKHNHNLRAVRPPQADEAMDRHPGSIETMVALPRTSPSSAWDFSCPDEPNDDSIVVNAEATSAFDISSEIVLLPLSLSDVEDEDFYERVKKMHALLEQTRREQEEAHDRLLQSHAELSESLLDAITDLVAESSGCGLDQLSTDDGAVDDSVVTEASDLRALRYVTG